MSTENILYGLCIIAMTPIVLMVLAYAMSHRSYSNYDQTH